MPNTVEEFLTRIAEQDIVEAIKLAELNTSGEIRVHIEKTSKGDVNQRVLEVFYVLKMDNTKLQNAVLIYVAVEDRAFAIYGDKGINDVVPKDFWNSTKNKIEGHFKTKNFKQGLIDGILDAGEQLKKHFPYTNLDTNELSNNISKG